MIHTCGLSAAARGFVLRSRSVSHVSGVEFLLSNHLVTRVIAFFRHYPLIRCEFDIPLLGTLRVNRCASRTISHSLRIGFGVALSIMLQLFRSDRKRDIKTLRGPLPPTFSQQNTCKPLKDHPNIIGAQCEDIPSV